MTTPQCSNCFFSFVAPASADTPTTLPARYAGKRFCNKAAPLAQNTTPNAWLWPPVADDWWCGEGADAVTGQAYSATVNGVPGPPSDGYAGTSITSLTIASSGSVAATTQTNLGYLVGTRTRLTSRSSAAWMEGVVSSYTAGVLTVTADLASGSGTYTDWNISVAGEPGTNGSPGTPGTTVTASNGSPGGGNDGDIWIQGPDTATQGVAYVVYQKAGGAWNTIVSWHSA